MTTIQKLALLGLTLLGTAGAGGQGALTPATLAGTWQGTVTEPDAGLSYEMTAQIAARPDLQGRFARVHYTNAEGCDVAWFLEVVRDCFDSNTCRKTRRHVFPSSQSRIFFHSLRSVDSNTCVGIN